MATILQMLPSQDSSIHIGRVMETKPMLEKLEPYQAVELATYEMKATYCADYIKQYDWNHTVAHNVMMQESSNNARTLNHNIQTGDYSVGCFQANLLGEGNINSKYKLAKQLGYTGSATRDELKEWLWNPSNNVGVAYLIYKDAGKSFYRDWGATTCKKIQCY